MNEKVINTKIHKIGDRVFAVLGLVRCPKEGIDKGLVCEDTVMSRRFEIDASGNSELVGYILNSSEARENSAFNPSFVFGTLEEAKKHIEAVLAEKSKADERARKL